jgi:hypothetical protein
MEFNSGYELGQTIYYVCPSFNNKNKIECDICEGKGFVLIKNKNFDCPKCEGCGFDCHCVKCGRICEAEEGSVIIGTITKISIVGLKNKEGHYKKEIEIISSKANYIVIPEKNFKNIFTSQPIKEN